MLFQTFRVAACGCPSTSASITSAIPKETEVRRSQEKLLQAYFKNPQHLAHKRQGPPPFFIAFSQQPENEGMGENAARGNCSPKSNRRSFRQYSNPRAPLDYL